MRTALYHLDLAGKQYSQIEWLVKEWCLYAESTFPHLIDGQINQTIDDRARKFHDDARNIFSQLTENLRLSRIASCSPNDSPFNVRIWRNGSRVSYDVGNSDPQDLLGVLTTLKDNMQNQKSAASKAPSVKRYCQLQPQIVAAHQAVKFTRDELKAYANVHSQFTNDVSYLFIIYNLAQDFHSNCEQ